jgi:hypothetical protein
MSRRDRTVGVVARIVFLVAGLIGTALCHTYPITPPLCATSSRRQEAWGGRCSS